MEMGRSLIRAVPRPFERTLMVELPCSVTSMRGVGAGGGVSRRQCLSSKSHSRRREEETEKQKEQEATQSADAERS